MVERRNTEQLPHQESSERFFVLKLFRQLVEFFNQNAYAKDLAYKIKEDPKLLAMLNDPTQEEKLKRYIQANANGFNPDALFDIIITYKAK